MEAIEDLNHIIFNNDIELKFNYIMKISKKMDMKNEDQITIKYRIKNNQKNIKLFGNDFIHNNKNICKILYKEKEY